MARRLLDADFILKTAQAGTFKQVDPALNVIDMMDRLSTKIMEGVATQAEKDAIEVGKTSYGTMTFRPGRMSYVDDADVVFIDCVQVMLVEKSWRDGTTNPVENLLYRDFAHAWTNHMAEIIPLRPDFRRMQDIFRMFALARILEKNFVFTHLSDQDVIEKYLVPMTSIPDHYSRSVTVNYVTNQKKTLRYRHCGGVTIPYQYTAPSQDRSSEVKSDVNLFARKVLESCTKETCWKVE